jgi:hypothetical protein
MMMSQFNAPARRSGGDIDVYTGLLFVAFLILAAGIGLLAMRNSDHSASSSTADDGGMIKLVQRR